MPESARAIVTNNVRNILARDEVVAPQRAR